VKPGDRVDRYLIEEVLGEGGMGRVFRAWDERLDRRVALKVLHDRGEGPESRARLVREARAAAKLDHPNVVAVYDVGEHESSPFVVMELVNGKSLRALIDDASVGADERIRIMTEVAHALAGAHDSGIVHRDVKPENVLVRSDKRVKVVDFGIARRTTPQNPDGSAPTEIQLSTLTADGVKVGTPAYMAPEQIRGNKVDGRADQFAWAVTAYELFVGKPPFTGDPMAVIAAILTEEPVPPPPAAKMPLAFASVLRRALSKRAEDRYPSMHAVVEAIEAAREPAPAAAPAPPPPRPASMPPGSMSPGSMPPVSPHVSYPMPYSQGPMLTRRYAPLEVAALFDRALAAQPRRYRYDDVARAANEVGVDAATAQQAMNQLALRGTVEQSPREKEADMMRVRRLLGIFGVLASFFLLLNLSDLHDIWFQYPVICLAVPFGLMIVTTIFRSPKKVGLVHGDAMFEHDVARLTEYLRVRPEAHPASLAPPPLRIATPSAPPAPAQSETMRQAEAEVEAFLASSPSRADRAQGK